MNEDMVDVPNIDLEFHTSLLLSCYLDDSSFYQTFICPPNKLVKNIAYYTKYYKQLSVIS